MKSLRVCLLLALAGLGMVGCSSVETGQRHNNANLDALKSAYIISPPYANSTICRHIGESLNQRGVRVRVGTAEAKPTDIDLLIDYTDHWQWDLVMYLHSLDIRFTNPTNGQLLASGAFRQSLFHAYPNLEKTVYEVVDSIYQAK